MSDSCPKTEITSFEELSQNYNLTGDPDGCHAQAFPLPALKGKIHGEGVEAFVSRLSAHCEFLNGCTIATKTDCPRRDAWGIFCHLCKGEGVTNVKNMFSNDGAEGDGTCVVGLTAGSHSELYRLVEDVENSLGDAGREWISGTIHQKIEGKELESPIHREWLCLLVLPPAPPFPANSMKSRYQGMRDTVDTFSVPWLTKKLNITVQVTKYLEDSEPETFTVAPTGDWAPYFDGTDAKPDYRFEPSRRAMVAMLKGVPQDKANIFDWDIADDVSLPWRLPLEAVNYCQQVPPSVKDFATLHLSGDFFERMEWNNFFHMMLSDRRQKARTQKVEQDLEGRKLSWRAVYGDPNGGPVTCILCPTHPDPVPAGDNVGDYLTNVKKTKHFGRGTGKAAQFNSTKADLDTAFPSLTHLRLTEMRDAIWRMRAERVEFNKDYTSTDIQKHLKREDKTRQDDVRAVDMDQAHIAPATWGNMNDKHWWNIVPTCATCNRSQSHGEDGHVFAEDPTPLSHMIVWLVKGKRETVARRIALGFLTQLLRQPESRRVAHLPITPWTLLSFTFGFYMILQDPHEAVQEDDGWYAFILTSAEVQQLQTIKVAAVVPVAGG